MISARGWEVVRLDLRHNLTRPLFWLQLLILGFFMYALAGGHASIGSGDTRVGGSKAFINSEFAIAQLLIILSSALYVFFISVGAGMTLIQDDELKVGEILHTTRLTPGEYVWGKFFAVLLSFGAVMILQLTLQALFDHALPHATNAEYIGPFVWSAYVRPFLIFGVPALVLFCGTCFALGALTRQPVLVFALPIAVLVLGLSILWDWSPAWLPLWANRLLQFIDLTGLRWLQENYLSVDRGTAFYNHAHIGLDGLIITQRLLAIALGLGSVALVQARFTAHLKGKRIPVSELPRAIAATPARAADTDATPLAAMAMTSAPAGFAADVRSVLGTELKLLGRHPGLYLFVPLILIQIFGGLVTTGAFDTPLLQTPGLLAAANMNTLTLLICMLILFYTAESLQRERSTSMGPILYATPVRTDALLAGKALANALLGSAIIVAALIGSAIVLAIQGKVPFSIAPFAWMWGLLLLPTFLVWTTFIAAVYANTSNRYATYAIGLAAMSLTGWFQLRGKMNWVFNWDLWSATRWTDIATFQLDGLPLLLNRIMVLGLAVLFIVITVQAFERRERDATRNVQRMRPAALARGLLVLLPWMLVPLGTGIALALQVANGWEGARAIKQQHDYWAKNALTYRDAPVPSLAGVDVDLRLEPATRGIRSRGVYVLVNHTDAPLTRIPLSRGPEWKEIAWTLDGRRVEPEHRAGLEVFPCAPPLAVGDTVRIGWTFASTVPPGASKNGDGLMEFVLPSSCVLTGFSSTNLAPFIGYQADVGVEDDKNKADPKEYASDFYEGRTRAGLAMAESWYATHLRIDVPADLEVNATGECVSDSVLEGRRITQWRSDEPVRIWNVVAGHWQVKRGDGVAVYYDAQHPYNVDEMLEALVAARRWYGTWFAPFPWKQLRLSEFAGLRGYAQGSPGNITFSESIGFLTQSKPEANAAFWVTAHESAHQWWPNMAMMGEGPGGDVLSEGMAHFSTILLTEQVKGLEQRMAFCQSIEERYARSRRSDGERPLTRIDGSLPAEGRIIYDKGGFALWMLFQAMGRERGLAAQQDYLRIYRDNPDHPVLQDYLAVLRRHAAEPAAFDSLADQWFYKVVVPQYQILDPVVTREGSLYAVRARVKNVGTGVMPIEVAACRGTRFPHPAKKASDYQDARTQVTLAAGQEVAVTIRTPFAPERLMVDPDVKVLQLERKKADVPLHAPSGGR